MSARRLALNNSAPLRRPAPLRSPRPILRYRRVTKTRQRRRDPPPRDRRPAAAPQRLAEDRAIEPEGTLYARSKHVLVNRKPGIVSRQHVNP